VREKSSLSIQSVDRAVALLQALGADSPTPRVTELAQLLGLHKSTVSRLLSTLEKHGLVEQDPETKWFRLGVGLITLGAQVRSDLRQAARQPLELLCKQVQETVNLAVLDGDEVINVDQFLPDQHQIKNIGWVGRRAPLYCSSTGKTLLAYLAPKEIERIIAAGLPAITPNTITDAGRLRSELASIRERGYGVGLEEFEVGLCAVSAPVYDRNGTVVAVVNASGPSYRVTADKVGELAQLAVQAARAVSLQLGYRERQERST
jgi:IclR family acetate operon transcriptional repressor